jgi:hypothetical protein
LFFFAIAIFVWFSSWDLYWPLSRLKIKWRFLGNSSRFATTKTFSQEAAVKTGKWYK